MTPSQADLSQTGVYWGAEGAWQTGRGLYWLELPQVQARLNNKASGRADVDWVQYTLERHFADRLPLPRCLSLGCGEGGLERQLASLGAMQTCDAVDIAPASIARAQSRAEKAGYRHLHYTVQDINHIELPAGQYDAVWASGAVHHVERLEHLFAQVAATLKPGGLFVLNEYVGPSRFQFPARQRQIIHACNDLLPPEYRRIVAAPLQGAPVRLDAANRRSLTRRFAAKLKGGDLIPALWRRVQRLRARQTGTRLLRATVELPTASSVAAIDPSEAIRSADIMPALREHFDIVEYRPLGGAILQFLLADIAGNFETEEGERLLQMLFTIEDILMEVGDLPNDFAYIVAHPRIGEVSVPAAETPKALP